MEPLDLITRLKAMAVLGGIFYLTVGITDAFVNTAAIRDLIFHSRIFYVVQMVVLWFAAPIAVKILRIDTKRDMTVLAVVILLGGLLLIGAELLVFWLLS